MLVRVMFLVLLTAGVAGCSFQITCDDSPPRPQQTVIVKVNKAIAPRKTLARTLPTLWNQLIQQFPGITSARAQLLESHVIPTLLADARKRDPNYEPPEFSHYYRVFVPESADSQTKILVKSLVKDLTLQLNQATGIDFAYVEPWPIPPQLVQAEDADLANQKYLGPKSPAPYSTPGKASGVNTREYWPRLTGVVPSGVRGTEGRGIQIGIVEGDWDASHPELDALPITLTGLGQPRPHFEPSSPMFANNRGVDLYGYTRHGTKTLSVIGAKDDRQGVVGICPYVNAIYVASYHRAHNLRSVSDAILEASAAIRPGDVLLIEASFLDAQSRLAPVEVYQLEYAAIRMAVDAGRIVIEPTGSSVNPVNLASILPGGQDSGAIMVGAALPLLEAADHGFPAGHRGVRTNYGDRVDCFAWGGGVATADIQSQPHYAHTHGYFSGSSSASAIIAGVVMSIQGVFFYVWGEAPEPDAIRGLLKRSDLSTPGIFTRPNGETVATYDYIGGMPNLDLIWDALTIVVASAGLW